MPQGRVAGNQMTHNGTDMDAKCNLKHVHWHVEVHMYSSHVCYSSFNSAGAESN